MKEHFMIEYSRTTPLSGARERLRVMFVGAMYENDRSRALVSEYRDDIAAHKVAESILDEREEAAAAAGLAAALGASALLAAPHPQIRREGEKTILKLPRRPHAPTATHAA